MIITIDGPVASGKSSIAKALSQTLGYYYLYTGLLYRAVAYLAVQEGKNPSSLTEKDLWFIPSISYEYVDGNPRIYFKERDITDNLFNVSIDQPASIVGECGIVRAALLEIQRSIAERYDIVADGRDCGSVIFPNAEYKFYLTASVDERVRRLHGDKHRKAFEFSSEKLKAELEERDKRDKERSVAPLIIPKDAIVVDNSEMNFQQTLSLFLKKIQISHD